MTVGSGSGATGYSASVGFGALAPSAFTYQGAAFSVPEIYVTHSNLLFTRFTKTSGDDPAWASHYSLCLDGTKALGIESTHGFVGSPTADPSPVTLIGSTMLRAELVEGTVCPPHAQVWTGTMTVGTSGSGATGYSTGVGFGALAPSAFTYRGAAFSVPEIYVTHSNLLFTRFTKTSGDDPAWASHYSLCLDGTKALGIESTHGFVGSPTADPSPVTLTLGTMVQVDLVEGTFCPALLPTPTVALALTPATISEAYRSSAVTATISPPLSAPTAITVSAAPVTPATSGDFNLSANTTLTILAGATTSTGLVTITAVDNDVDAPDRTVTVSGDATNTHGVVDPAGVTLTIADDDDPPKVTLALSQATINESGDGNVASVTAEIDRPSSAATTITVSAAAVSPATSSDFNLSSNRTLTIQAGATTSSGLVTIAAVNDNVDAPNRSVTVSGDATNTQGVVDPAGVTLTITDDDDAPKVTLRLSSSSIGENGGRTTVTAEIDRPSSAATTIAVSAAAVPPATSGDFNLSANTTLTIQAGATTSTGLVTIAAVDNDVDAPDRTVTVSGNATNTHGVVDPASVTLTIADDDDAPKVTLALSPGTINESGDGNVATVTATLDRPSSAATTIAVSAAAVPPATSGDSNLSSNTTLTIQAGATTSTGLVTITAVDNDVDAPDRTVTVWGDATNTRDVVDPAGVTLTIADDDDAPKVTLRLGSSSIAENGGQTTVTATLDRPSSAATTIAVSAAAVSPATSGDFNLSANRTLTIRAGATASSGDVTIAAVNNNVDGPNKSVTVSGDATNTQGVVDPAGVTLTIDDDDDAPKVTLRLESSAIGEFEGQTRVTATLDRPSSAATTITVSAAAVPPATSSDFNLSANRTLTIQAGATTSSGDVTIAAVNNNVDEPHKSVTVSGDATNAHGVVDPADVTLTIVDNDNTPTATLQLTSSSIGENGGRTTVTAEIDRPSSAATTITVSAAAVSPATSSDFNLSANTTLTIQAGATTSTGSVTIAAVNNNVDAPNRGVTVSGDAMNTQGVVDPTDVTLTITDDDDAPKVTLRLSSSSIGENGGRTTVTAEIDRPSSAATTIAVSAAAVPPGTSSDFDRSANTTLTIQAGATSSAGIVTITAVDNEEDSLSKSVTVTALATNAQGITNPDAVTLTITDDDPAPAVTLVLTPASIGENGGTTTVTARIDRPSTGDTTITVEAAAVSPAVAGDFTLSTNADLTIQAGATTSTGTVTITANDNTTDAPDKRVTVRARASNSVGITNPANVTLTIEDEDPAPKVTLVLSQATINESGDGNVTTVTAELDRPSSQTTRVAVSAAAVSPAVAGDFTLSTNRTLTIQAGATTSTGTVTITANDNNVDAPNKSVTVSGDATNTQGITDPDDVTLTIADDEGSPTVVLMLSSSSITENGGTSTVTARINRPSSAGTTIRVALTPVSPALGADATLSANADLTIAAGATTSTGDVTITANDNNVDAPNKRVTVGATAMNSVGIEDPADLTLTITDDDPAPVVTLVLDSTSISENGGMATVTATLDRPSSNDTQVDIGVTPVSPAVAGDFTLSANRTLTVAAGATTSTGDVTITANDDNVDTDDKTVTVRASSLRNSQGAVSPGDRSLTITDDDARPSSISVTLNPASVDEGAGPTEITVTVTAGGGTVRDSLTYFTIYLCPAVAGTVDAGQCNNQANRAGTAQPADFVPVSPPGVVIPAFQTSHSETFQFTPVDDDEDDDNETVKVVAEHSALTIVPATLTIVDNDTDSAPTVSDASQFRDHIAFVNRTFRLTLPAADAGSGNGEPFTYALRVRGTGGQDLGAAPHDGLRFAPSTRILNGRPTASGTILLAYEIHDSDANQNAGDAYVEQTSLQITVREEPAVVVSAAALALAEGGTADYDVHLASEPTGDVTLNVVSSDGGAVTAMPASLTFTPADYDSPQSVTVTSLQDADAVNENVTVGHTAAAGSAAEYIGAAFTAVLVAVDDDETGGPGPGGPGPGGPGPGGPGPGGPGPGPGGGGDDDDGGDGGPGPGPDPGGGGSPPRAAIRTDASCAEGLCRAVTGAPVTFVDVSTGTVHERAWDFDDGTEPRRERRVRHSWFEPGFYSVTLYTSNGVGESTATLIFLVEASQPEGTCEANAETRCLLHSRYEVSVTWWTREGLSGAGKVVNEGTNETGLFWFFDPANWEVLIKVLDGCAVNGNVWVYAASTTDVGYEIRAVDTVTGAAKTYVNELGRPAPAITDSSAFPGGCR